MAEQWLFFVDTNIFLDFYRLPGESAKRQLSALERHAGRLITGDQVRMEFLKNRQKVILKSISELRQPSLDGVPQILAETRPAIMMMKHQKVAKSRFKDLKDRAEKVLSDPSHYDPVFQAFNRIFDANSDFNLRRPKKDRFEIRNLARKRFVLGYPPRKSGDTSIGDAINWEWVVRCAQAADANTHVLIVSRDGDFGAQVGQKSYLNDWLRREFKDRVSSKRKIELTSKLTDALKLMDEIVTSQDEQEEETLIKIPRMIKFGDLLRYARQASATRTLMPDPEIEAILAAVRNDETADAESADLDTFGSDDSGAGEEEV